MDYKSIEERMEKTISVYAEKLAEDKLKAAEEKSRTTREDCRSDPADCRGGRLPVQEENRSVPSGSDQNDSGNHRGCHEGKDRILRLPV